MRKYLLILLLFICAAGLSQAPNIIYGKHVIIQTRDTSSAELTIKNSTRNVLGYFKNIGGGEGRYILIPQIDITGLPDSLLSRYTKTQSDERYKPIGYSPSWGEITGIPANFTTTYALSNDIQDTSRNRVPYENATRSLNLGNYRLSARGLLGDTIYARGSGGGFLATNSGSVIASYGAGGSNEISFMGFAGQDYNRSGSFTDLSFITKKWADSLLALKKNIADTFFTTGYTTRERIKQQIDSLGFRANDYRVHIKDFGADSTGVTNSTNAILNAIAEAKLRGAALVIDPGTYWISQALPISNYHKEIIGYNSTIRQTGNDEIFFISDCDNLSIKGVKIVGNKQSLQTGVYVIRSNQMDIDIRFDSLYRAVYIDQTQANGPPYEQNNMVRVIGGRSVYGVFLNSSAEYVTVHNSIIHDIDSIGVWIRGGNNGVVGTTIHGSNIGIYVQGTFAPNSDHGRIVGNVINHYETCGVLLEYLRFSHIVSGNDIWAAGTGNLYGTGKAFGIYIKKSGGATITSNTIASNPISIGLDSSDFNNISSNTFLNFLSLTEANIKEYGSQNSYNNTITTNNFLAVSGAKVDSVVLLSGSSFGGSSYAKKSLLQNPFGGTNPSNYMQIVGATGNNLNYPGIELKGGTLATTYPRFNLSNGGLGAFIRSGTSGSFPGISEARMDATEGFSVLNNTTGNPDLKFRVELGGRLRAYSVETGATSDQLLTINTDTIRKIPTSLVVLKADTAAILDKVTFDRALRNGSTSGRSFTSGAATLLGTRNNTPGTVNLNLSSTAGYGFRINTSNELVLDAFNGATWAEAHKWALGGASFNYSRFYGTSVTLNKDSILTRANASQMGVAIDTATGNLVKTTRGRYASLVLNKDSVPITTTNVMGLTLDSASGRVQRIVLPASGTYTPTITSVANLSSTTAQVCYYTRVGDIVTVSGFVQTQTVSDEVVTTLDISLPIASNFTSAVQLSGSSSYFTSSFGSHQGLIKADATNDRATVSWLPMNGSGEGDVLLQFTFTYRIL